MSGPGGDAVDFQSDPERRELLAEAFPEAFGRKPDPQCNGKDDQEARLAAVREYLPRLDLAALMSVDRPPRSWLWWRLIPAGAAVALVAPAGTGKSLLLLALVIAITRGDRAFAGLRITNPRVLMIDMENTEDDLAERLRDLGVTADNAAKLDDLAYLHLPMLPPLDTPAGGVALLALVDGYHIRAGDVVVLDSIQRLTSGKENDSDTIRAYYLHTGIWLKRRGITVIRTDNTGKDADRGARGSSGKRDDIDVELIMEPDSSHPGRVSIKPGKLRLPDIDSIILDQLIDEDGRIYYDSASDPFRAKVVDAIAALERHAIPVDLGERKVAVALKGHGEDFPRAALRVAIKERRHLQK
jgi:AAA domain